MTLSVSLAVGFEAGGDRAQYRPRLLGPCSVRSGRWTAAMMIFVRGAAHQRRRGVSICSVSAPSETVFVEGCVFCSHGLPRSYSGCERWQRPQLQPLRGGKTHACMKSHDGHDESDRPWPKCTCWPRFPDASYISGLRAVPLCRWLTAA